MIKRGRIDQLAAEYVASQLEDRPDFSDVSEWAFEYDIDLEDSEAEEVYARAMGLMDVVEQRYLYDQELD